MTSCKISPIQKPSPKLVDQTGRRYGALVVIGLAGRVEDTPGHTTTVWRCRCDCGAEMDVRRTNLKTAKSCGCLRTRHVVDIQPGQIYGQLTTVSFCDKRFSGHRAWNCRCACGNDTVAIASELVSGGHVSCAQCKTKRTGQRFRKPAGHSGKMALFSAYRSSARDRGLAFNITFDQFVELTSKNCTYCGTPPSSFSRHGNSEGARKHSTYIYNGLDRVKNEHGYELDNVVTCCSTCNYAKGGLSQDAFIQWILRASRHLIGEGA